jgi:hypothetical protein
LSKRKLRGRAGRDWNVDFASTLVDRLRKLAKTAGAAGVFSHWYAGDVASETLKLQRLPSCDLDDLPQRAAELNEDQILIVKAIRGA